MSSTSVAYRGLPADERQEFRLPALLKEHVTQAALQSGQTIAEYITNALAERVTADLASAAEWTLTVPEQETLLRALSGAPGPSARARKVAAKADAVFGTLDGKKKKR
jgi:uncharacterized protein (DUF1778 family)